MRMFIRLKLCYWREKIHPWQYQDCPHLRSAPVPIIWIKMLTSGPDWALGPALHAVQRAFFGSCKEPSKSLCCFCVCVFVFKTEFRLSLAMNESWMGHKCVSRQSLVMLSHAQSCSVMLSHAQSCSVILCHALMLNDAEWCCMMLYGAVWCCMMLYDAEWWLLIEQEPHDRLVLLLSWWRATPGST